MIPADFIETLLEKIDIVDIIDERVPLKKGGANYMACCPFHKEKSPSFSVSPSKQFYHCFGCGAHGSAIGFLMEYQNLSFVEAVQYLADRVGMRVPQDNGQAPRISPEQRAAKQKQQQTLEHTLQTCTQFYEQQLHEHPAAQHYLQQRGLDARIIQHYQLGYAPNDWQGLESCVSEYPNAALIESGQLVFNEEKQKYYDRFRHRIMFPIRDTRGQVIGFGGRVLDDSKPKYLNSPDTPLFDKGKNLYGLYEAKQAIKEANCILVVEGYMDVVSLAQFGVGYAVAALGTSTTSEHIKLLMRQTDHIYFCFDGDEAGKKAAWRALENALPQLKDDKSLHFLFLPSAHDPDSYIRAYGKAQFEEALHHQSKPLSEYFWSHLTEGLALHTQEGKSQLIKAVAPLLKQIQAPALGFLLKQTLSQLTGIDDYNLAQLLGQTPTQRQVKAKDYRLPSNTFRQPSMPTLVQKQIRALLHHPEWVEHVNLPDYLVLSGDLACLATLAEWIQHSSLKNTAAILEYARNSEYAEMIQQIVQESDAAIAWQESDAEDDHTQHEVVAFADGMNKLIKELSHVQIRALREKAANGALSEAEKQLLLQLLMNKAVKT